MTEGFALVTGASSGIGYELAKELANRGFDLVVASAGPRLAPAAEAFRNLGAEVIEANLDLATRDGVHELWQKVEQTGRPVDIACINAGVGVGGLFDETELDAELNMIELNCAGTVQLAKHVVRQMKSLRAGRILFTASIAGEMVAPREAVYAATKAFVLSFAHSLNYELKDTGVTVTALQPGPTDTNFFHRAGMDNTEVGQKGKTESQASEVARQGIEALLDGKDHVYAASAKTKIEGMVAKYDPWIGQSFHARENGYANRPTGLDQSTRVRMLRREKHYMSNALHEKPRAEEVPVSSSASVIINGRYLPPPSDRDGKIWVRASALIQAPADQLYEYWRDVEQAPQWQEQIVDVRAQGNRSHWVMKSGDQTIEWDAEVLADEPGKRIAWRSFSGDSDNAGEVIFEAASGGRGTMVTVLQEFRMSKLASAWETLTGRNPKQSVIENLRHFKALAEAGEIPRTEPQPHGERGLIGNVKRALYSEPTEQHA